MVIESQIIYIRDIPLVNWLVGRWHLNEGNGTIVYDDSGRNNDGILIGSTMWENHSQDLETHGFYLCFDTPDDYVRVPYNSSLVVTDEFTITCWIKVNEKSNGSNILGVKNSWQLLEKNGSLEVKLWRTNGLINITDIAALPIGNWSFIGLTYNHGILRIIVRSTGKCNVSVVYDLGDYSIVDSGNPLIFGGFVGCIDEIWLFNRDISMNEVESIWFTPYPVLGSLHDVVVQHLPSFTSFSLAVNGKQDTNITTEDTIEFVGFPSNFIFEWDFGDGTHAFGQNGSHRYDAAGFYTIICNATDPTTDSDTNNKTIYVADATPPIFSGIQTIINGSNNVTLSWNPQ